MKRFLEYGHAIRFEKTCQEIPLGLRKDPKYKALALLISGSDFLQKEIKPYISKDWIKIEYPGELNKQTKKNQVLIELALEIIKGGNNFNFQGIFQELDGEDLDLALNALKYRYNKGDGEETNNYQIGNTSSYI